MRSQRKVVSSRVWMVVAAALTLYVVYAHYQGAPRSQASFLRGSLGTVWGESTKNNYRIAMVSDLDRMSKVSDSKKPAWKSVLKRATLRYRPKLKKYEIDYDVEPTNVDLVTHLGEAGRGMELSELVVYNGELLSFDDRTGVGFKIDKSTLKAFPAMIFMEGDGESGKGQKSEWAAVKNDELYVGSFGKEYTNPDGSVAKRWNLWVSIVDANGNVRHEDWTDKYEVLRKACGASFPGYMIHEAIRYDAINSRWIVMPRRVSSEPYDEKKDEIMGSNVVLILNADFSKVVEKLEIGPQIPLRGWSSFAFVPGTKNDVVVALKTEETEDKTTGDSKQTTYITVFKLSTGKELMEQTEVPGKVKYEGVEFL